MNQQFFWKSWRQPYKSIFLLLLFFSLAAFSLSWFWYVNGNDNVLSWLTGQTLKSITLPVHQFQLGQFNMSIDAEYFVLMERMFSSDLIPQTFPLYFFLFATVLALVVLLSIISTLSRYWYLLGMAAFILFVVSIGLPQLRMFGRADNIPIVVMLLLYLVPSYYLQSFSKDTDFIKRLFVFTFVTLICAVLIYFFADVQSPILHLAAFIQTVPLIITVLFIFIVSHEIPASFITVLSTNAFKGKSAHQFFIIVALYLINLTITYLQYIYIIDWNFIYINLFLLLSISAVLGLWGFRNREPQYQNILDFSPLGAYLFLALALIAFSFIGQAYANANDPYIKVIRDAILYSHLGYGIIFVTYVASNFLSLLSNNMPVNKVLYKPNRMPYFTFNLAGLIATLAFVFVNNWKVPYFNSYAGYYNSIADTYNIADEPDAAEGYYRLANANSFGLDHHSNFVIAGIERSKYENVKERIHLQKAIELRPSTYAYVDLANNYLRSGFNEDAFSTLLKAYNMYPDKGAVSNNLALLFYNRQAYDSAFYLLTKSVKDKSTNQQATANIYALSALDDLDLDADSLSTLYKAESYSAKANQIALRARQGLSSALPNNLLTDSIMNGARLALINNYVLSMPQAFHVDDINSIENLARLPANKLYNELMLFNTAILSYHKGQVARAVKLLNEIGFFNFENTGKYNYVLGLWALEQENVKAAVKFLEKALEYNYPDAAFPMAVAYTEAGMKEEALQIWDALSIDSEEFELIAKALGKVLRVNLNEIDELSDAEKYQLSRYRIAYTDTTAFFKVVNSISTAEYVAQAYLDLSKKYFKADELNMAIRIFNRISGLALQDVNLYNRIQLFEIHLLAAQRDFVTLAQTLSPELLKKFNSLEQTYFTTLLYDLDETARRANFEILGSHNPYFEEAILAAAEYFRGDEDNRKSYNILVDAVILNPESVKLNKAYAMEAMRSGYKAFAVDALERLQNLLPERAYLRFIKENEALLTEEQEF